jgi:glycosyltransferase involved in cell wall biosynthesis
MEVSIIIPYREERGFLAEAVASAENQTGFILNKDYEIILQKGEYRLGKNVNDGVAKAKGKYIKILADDDLLTPNCLLDLWTKAEEGFDFVCADAIDFGFTEGDLYHESVIPLTVGELGNYNSIHGGTVLYLKSAMPPWDEQMWCAEEYEMTLRMADMGLRFGYINKIVSHYRIHGLSKTSEMVDVYRGEDEKVYRWEYIEELHQRYIRNTKKINRGH